MGLTLAQRSKPNSKQSVLKLSSDEVNQKGVPSSWTCDKLGVQQQVGTVLVGNVHRQLSCQAFTAWSDLPLES